MTAGGQTSPSLTRPCPKHNETISLRARGSTGYSKTRALLYHDLAMHKRMQAADVGKSRRLVEFISERLVGIEHFGMDPESGQKNTVRNIILIGPGHLGSLADG